MAVTIPSEESCEQGHARLVGVELEGVTGGRTLLSRRSFRVIGEGNAQGWTPPPIKFGDGKGGYHCTRWSNSISGSGWVSGSLSCSTSTGESSQSGGPRAGEIAGGRVGSPMCSTIARTQGVSIRRRCAVFGPESDVRFGACCRRSVAVSERQLWGVCRPSPRPVFSVSVTDFESVAR